MFKLIFDKLFKNENAKQNEYGARNVTKSLDENVALLKNIFTNDDTVIYRFFTSKNGGIKCCLIYIDGMVDKIMVDKDIISRITEKEGINPVDNLIDILSKEVVTTSDAVKTGDVNEIVGSIIYGDTVLFVDGFDNALILSTKGWQTRNITEPFTEKVVKGPKEGFTEAININLSMVRRRLRTPDLKFEFITLGQRSNTSICVCYIKNIVNEKILKELYKRLNDINIDAIIDSGYISELIGDSPFSPFKTVGSTERPDIVAANLMEGRIAVFCDGTPFVLTLPYLFVENFQANEDYYNHYIFASINKLLRYVGFFLSTCIPAVYVSLVTFHQEMIPTPLILSISAARQGVPFPTVLETLLMLIVFEILREAGLRLPTNTGQAVSIVGALVLGEAAVNAKLISAPIIIVVAITGISSFMIPKMTASLIVVRFGLLLISSLLGLYGFTFGLIAILLILTSMRSFGVPYTLNINAISAQDIKDTAIRAPWWYMDNRPKILGKMNYVRQGSGNNDSKGKQ